MSSMIVREGILGITIFSRTSEVPLRIYSEPRSKDSVTTLKMREFTVIQATTIFLRAARTALRKNSFEPVPVVKGLTFMSNTSNSRITVKFILDNRIGLENFEREDLEAALELIEQNR